MTSEPIMLQDAELDHVTGGANDITVSFTHSGGAENNTGNNNTLSATASNNSGNSQNVPFAIYSNS